MGVLYILRGLPGSGKDYYIRERLGLGREAVCSADHFFERSRERSGEGEGEYIFEPQKLRAAHKACQEKCRALMETGTGKIAVSNTNIRLKEMQPYLDLAEEYGYRVVIIRMEVPIDISVHRNTHGVPEETIRKMAEALEPHPSEVVVRNG